MNCIGIKQMNCLNPESLYNLAVKNVACNYQRNYLELKIFPPMINIDILYKVYEIKKYDVLEQELSSFDKICKLLKVPRKRCMLHRCFQAAVSTSYLSKTKRSVVLSKLKEDFIEKSKKVLPGSLLQDPNCYQFYRNGILLASFLSEAGWFETSICILSVCLQIANNIESTENLLEALDCYQKLLHAQNGYCLFKDAEATFNKALEVAEELEARGVQPKVAYLYCECSVFHIIQSKYKESYEWGVKSTEKLLLEPDLDIESVIDILRQAGKACILKRDFKSAGLLIKQAIVAAKYSLGENHPKFATTLNDFGYYLLNVDEITQSLEMYRSALNIREKWFSGINLQVGIAHEDLAYASYVHNYSRGTFDTAKHEADTAYELLHQILPEGHFHLSSSKRVKALILEEMAIDCHDKEIGDLQLKEAYDLHTNALTIAQNVFGENNVQTAKHYGNLGRLMQSMKKFEVAEAMHLKAISIKESLLGPSDYEVALSIGHLASLYNYDMKRYDKAEPLYLRSIGIGVKIFGESYSGLVYDYQGLLRAYTELMDFENREHILEVLREYQILRSLVSNKDYSAIESLSPCIDINATLNEFFASL